MNSGAQRTIRVVRPRPLLMALLCLTALANVSFAQQVSVTGRVELFQDGSVRSHEPVDAVVWLTPTERGEQAHHDPAPQHLQLVQRNKSFSPHILVVQVGESVEFPNKDPFFHNVFSLFEGKRFDLGLYESGTSRKVVFDREGISYIFCNIHSDMSAVVVALQTPYYGITDPEGRIAIPNVPPGRYQLRIWQERAVPESLQVLTRTILISET